jgi:hypothetical protein
VDRAASGTGGKNAKIRRQFQQWRVFQAVTDAEMAAGGW